MMPNSVHTQCFNYKMLETRLTSHLKGSNVFVIEGVLDVSEDAGGLPHAALAQEHDLEVVVLGLAHLFFRD